MEDRRIQSKSRYLIAFVIGTLIFVAGFALTYGISYAELVRINSLQQDTAYDIFSDKLKYSFFNEDICSVESYNSVSADLGFQGRMIDDMERKFGKTNDRVLFRKKFYTLVELEHFEYIKDRNTKCSSFVNTVLFFYSNTENLKASEEAGRILATVPEDGRSVVIYSFDVDLNSELVTMLKEKYNITSTHMIVVNEGQAVEINSVDDVESRLQ